MIFLKKVKLIYAYAIVRIEIAIEDAFSSSGFC